MNMINKNLILFLEKIINYDLNFNPISINELKSFFKNNEYYNLKNFCLENNLIIFEYGKVIPTKKGRELHNVIKNILYF